VSKKAVTSLHIEWTPGWVQAINVATGESASGIRLSDLSSLVSKHRHALVGVGRNAVFLKALRLPKATPDDLRRILNVQIAQFFPLPPQQLAFDFLQTADQTGEGCLTLVAAMRAEDLKQLRRDLQQAGLTATRILPISLGAPVVAARAGRTDALVLENASGGLALDVVQGGSLRFSRLAPSDSDPLCEAQRTLAAASAGSLPLLATGGVVLPEALPTQGSALMFLDEAPPFHFELAEEREREAKQRIGKKMRLAALMVIAAVLLDVLIWADRSDEMAVVQRGQATWARELRKLRAIRTSETSKAQRVTTMQATLARAFQPAQPLSDLVSVVGDSLPANTWLTGLTVERGKTLQIRGTARTAEDVSRYVQALSATARFRDVKIVFANSGKIEKTPVVQFNVTATGIGNLPLPTPAKQTGKGARRRARPAAEPGGTATEPRTEQ